jgi:hypothetical protein
MSAGCGSAPRHPSPAIDDWRGGRVAEGARLESVFTGNRNVGSNPTPSANFQCQVLYLLQLFFARQFGPNFREGNPQLAFEA